MQTVSAYGAVLSNAIRKSDTPTVIVIDSIERTNLSLGLDWLPTELPENVKLILTLSVTTEAELDALNKLRNRVKSPVHLVHLLSFADEQWKEMITSGGNDFSAANGALQLPQEWSDPTDKTPIHAKVRVRN